MAKSQGDRVRAAKLRARKTPLSAADALWLREYERGVTKSTIAKAKVLAPAPAATVRGPQLAIAGTSGPGSSLVQETLPPDGNVTPDAHVWTPTVPPAAEGADAPPPGAPPPPAAGAPVIDATSASSSSAPPDTAAAASFAAMMQLIVHVGLGACVELGADMPIPAELRGLLADAGMHEQVKTVVGGAAYRVAIKHGFTSVPFADESIVIAAVVGSAAAYRAVWLRKQLGKPAKPPKAAPPAQAAPPAPDDDLSKVWDP